MAQLAKTTCVTNLVFPVSGTICSTSAKDIIASCATCATNWQYWNIGTSAWRYVQLLNIFRPSCKSDAKISDGKLLREAVAQVAQLAPTTFPTNLPFQLVVQFAQLALNILY